MIAGKNTIDEYEANEFAHYILNPTKINRATTFVSTHKLISVIIGILLFSTIVTSIATPIILKQQTYYGNYYVTTTSKACEKTLDMRRKNICREG